MGTDKLLYDKKTKFERYQVVDLVYIGRAARVLFSGRRAAAQSGIPRDGNPMMLFDYNQRFLELVESLRPESILIIGGGAFTLPTEIIKSIPSVSIDVVEQDPELPKIAKQFFGLKPSKRLNIIIGDGREYLKGRQTYDLIILDAFVHNIIPPRLCSQEFVQLMKTCLNKNGVAATNIISAYYGPGNSIIKQQYATYSSVFKHVGIFPADNTVSYWISQNFILAATNKRLKPNYNLRFGSLKSPLTNSSDIQHDKL